MLRFYLDQYTLVIIYLYSYCNLLCITLILQQNSQVTTVTNTLTR